MAAWPSGLPCFSTNLAAFGDQDGKIICELLPSDKYNNSDKFIENAAFPGADPGEVKWVNFHPPFF